MISSFPARWENSTSKIRSRVSESGGGGGGSAFDRLLTGGAGAPSTSSPSNKKWIPGTRPGMTKLSSLRLLRPVIGDASDDSRAAEFLAQIVHRALRRGRTAVEHVGVVGLRSRAQGADAGAHQTESGAVDFLRQHLAANSKDFCRELRRGVSRLWAGGLS